jgi:hypothetical protein
MWVVLPPTLSSELKRRDVPNCTEEDRKGRMATWGEQRCAVGHLAGYYAAAFQDAFVRYPPAESATPPQAYSRSDCGAFQNATSIEPVARSKSPQAHSDGHYGGVAVSNPFPGLKGARPMSNGAHGRIVPPGDRRPALVSKIAEERVVCRSKFMN